LSRPNFGEQLFVIPQVMQETVLTHAEEITTQENAIRAGIRLGLRINELRRQHRYHDLQSSGYVEAETGAD
jgi:4-hydroxy-4-methyl-2-oxoglutarate aldolase